MRSRGVYCRKCSQEWRRDPALEVECPTCHAKQGRRCKRPSGHGVWGKEPHEERDRLAMETVPGYRRCPGTPHPELVVEETASGQLVFVLIERTPSYECTTGV